eukprot:g2537.t1
MGKKNKGGGGHVELTQVNKGKQDHTNKTPSSSSAAASSKPQPKDTIKKTKSSSDPQTPRQDVLEVDYYSKYFDDEMFRDILADSPDINRTASLYSKADCHKCICDCLQDVLQDAGFEECTSWLDLRLLCSLLACGIGLYTVAFLKFPADRDTMFYMKGPGGKWPTGHPEDPPKEFTYYGFTHLPPGPAIFYLVMLYSAIAGFVTYIDTCALGPSNVFSLRDNGKRSVHVSVLMDENTGPPTVTRDKCVSRYFDEEGYLVLENLFNDLCATIEKHCGHIPIFKDPVGKKND